MIYLLVDMQLTSTTILAASDNPHELEKLRERIYYPGIINPQVVPMKLDSWDKNGPIYWDVLLYLDEEVNEINFYLTAGPETETMTEADEEIFSWSGPAWSAEEAVELATDALRNYQANQVS